MPEFNLLQTFPKIKRAALKRIVTPEIKEIALREGFDYYDGDRKFGFGGYVYDGRWRDVAKTAKERYNLNPNSRVLIDRSEKGFLAYDLKKLIPGITVYGIHRSEYPLIHSMEGFGKHAMIHDNVDGIKDPRIIEEIAKKEIEPFLLKATTTDIPFKDEFFDTVISINSVCNYEGEACRKAVREITRVSKNSGEKSYIHVDSWRNESERQAMLDWILLTKAFFDTAGWEKLYGEEGYRGDRGFIIFDGENY